MQQELAQGRPPVASMIDGFLIFAAGVLLLVPGIITDVFGVAFLLPPVRALVRRGLANRLRRMAEAGTARFTIMDTPRWPRSEERRVGKERRSRRSPTA